MLICLWFNSITVPKLHRDTSLEADIMNVQDAILQFDEVASTLSLEDLHPEEREAIEEAVMCIVIIQRRNTMSFGRGSIMGSSIISFLLLHNDFSTISDSSKKMGNQSHG